MERMSAPALPAAAVARKAAAAVKKIKGNKLGLQLRCRPNLRREGTHILLRKISYLIKADKGET